MIELLHGDGLVMAAGAGELAPGILGKRLPLENTVASAALRSGQTQLLTDRLIRARFEYGHSAGRPAAAVGEPTDGVVTTSGP